MEDRPVKIFVGGLNFDIQETEFEKIFSKFGEVACTTDIWVEPMTAKPPLPLTKHKL